MSDYKAGERVTYFKPTRSLCQVIPAEFVAYCNTRVRIKIHTKDGEVFKMVSKDSIERADRGRSLGVLESPGGAR